MATDRIDQLSGAPLREGGLAEPRDLPAAAARDREPSYYGIPLLQRPVWTWEVETYFFLGGLSAGSYLIARMADWLGRGRYRAVSRAGTFVAVGAMVPCPVLLIADLGDPWRFHHMLRVFKPRSPMSLGTWTLTGYSGIVMLAALREWVRGRMAEHRSTILGRLFAAVTDAAGIPLAILLSGYTGVLLSGTATPVWSKNAWLGPLFTASGVANGAAAVRLFLQAREAITAESANGATQALERVNSAATVAEAGCLAGYLASAGPLARPLTQGKPRRAFWGAVAGLAMAELLQRAAGRRRIGRVFGLASAVAGLAAGFALKQAIVHAGPISADDSQATKMLTGTPS